MRHRILWMAILMTGLTLAGCGQKGPLYREAGSSSVQPPAPSPAPQERDEANPQSPESPSALPR